MRGIPNALVLILVVALAGGCASITTQKQNPKPSIVYIVTDDMRYDDLSYMPKTKSLIFDEGITYDDAFMTTSQCCPSRSSTLRGQYAHNTGVKSNGNPGSPPGGYSEFSRSGDQDSTIATWLHDAGYKTSLVGKYLNRYKDSDVVPPGWDDWHAFGQHRYYSYTLNENGRSVSYGSDTADYSTDVFAGKAEDFIDAQKGNSQSFFLYVAPIAPHSPAIPPERYKDAFPNATAPRLPSYDEQDVSDKPNWIQKYPRIDQDAQDEIDQTFRERVRTLQAVDDMVEGIINHLQDAGLLDNIYIVFSSDNGFHLGEHRIRLGKESPYEPSIRMPLGIRGPGIPAGRHTSQMAINEDFAPMFAELGGATAPSFVDGRSLVPTFATDASSWRKAFFEEFWDSSKVPRHKSVRTDTQEYILWADGFKEMYDLQSDPDEMDNLEKTQPQIDDSALASTFAALQACSGQSCKDAEDGTLGGSPADATATDDTPESTSRRNKEN